jgi:hypothetical protein
MFGLATLCGLSEEASTMLPDASQGDPPRTALFVGLQFPSTNQFINASIADAEYPASLGYRQRLQVGKISLELRDGC